MIFFTKRKHIEIVKGPDCNSESDVVDKLYEDEDPFSGCPSSCDEELTEYVCGSDGNTYQSECHVQLKNCQVNASQILSHLFNTTNYFREGATK